MASLPPLLLVGVGLLCLGEILNIVGLATPNWMALTVGQIDQTAGLFKSCSDSTCIDIEDPNDKLKAVRAMVILGVIFGIFAGATAIIFVIFKIMGKPAKSLFLLICLAASIGAGIFAIVGVAVYAAKIYKPALDLNSDVKLSFSFALCIVGALLTGVGGILSLLGGKPAAD